MQRTLAISIAFAFIVATLGCEDSGRLATHKTTGTIKYTDGKPIKEGSILFVCEGLPSGRAVIEEGEFTVGTYESADGAVAGLFRVGITVSPPIDYDPDDGRAPVGAKAKYNRPESSGLEFEVSAEGTNHFEIELERGR